MFTVKVINELKARKPENIKILKQMFHFKPSMCLRTIQPPIIDLTKSLGYSDGKNSQAIIPI